MDNIEVFWCQNYAAMLSVLAINYKLFDFWSCIYAISLQRVSFEANIGFKFRLLLKKDVQNNIWNIFSI